jgi:hypothetical protein
MRYALVLSWFLVGCTAQPVATTYWTQKSGVAVVHHVVGKTDTIEKLTEKQLTDDDVKSAGLPKGKYFKVVSAQAQVTPVAPVKTEPKANAKATDSRETDARLAAKIEDLSRQVQAISDENRRLQEQINASSEQQSTRDSAPQRTAEDSSTAPRLSQ